MTEQDRDSYFMHLALQEAVKGLGRTAPNPCVGAVIVKDSQIVGRGYHKKVGTAHAEIHALADAGSRARGSVMYVTLEPCNYIGRTPPCSHALVRAGISRVVIGMTDPNPLACGGTGYLISHNIKTVTGVCAEECRLVNLPFLKKMNTGLPWVVMKAGISLDGRISYQVGKGGVITGKKSAWMVHSLRNNVDAILVGIETALVDNPSLTTRLPAVESSDSGYMDTAGEEVGTISWQEQLTMATGALKSPVFAPVIGGEGIGICTRDPLRLVLDSELRFSAKARMLSQSSEASTWIFCSEEAGQDREEQLLEQGAVIHRVDCGKDGHLNLHTILKILGDNNITSLLVEGGSGIHGSFLVHELVDELYLFQAPFFIGSRGTPLISSTPAYSSGHLQKKIKRMSVQKIGDDILIHGFFTANLDL